MKCHGDELDILRTETEMDAEVLGWAKIAAALVYWLKVESSGLSLAQKYWDTLYKNDGTDTGNE